MKFKHN